MNSEPIGPVGNLDEQNVRFALAAASACAVGDRPPWHFHCGDKSIELHGEFGMRGDEAAPPDRAIRSQCGAALLNLRLAIRSTGVVPDVKLLPDPERPDLVATVGCSALDGPMPLGERRLVDVIHPHSIRPGLASGARLPDFVLAPLRAAARVEFAWLSEISGADRTAVQDLLGFDWDSSSRVGTRLVSIGSLTDHPVDQVCAGQATQRVVLTARAHSVTAASLPRLVDVDVARLSVRRLLGGGLWPQSVLSLGHRSPASDADRPPPAQRPVGAPSRS